MTGQADDTKRELLRRLLQERIANPRERPGLKQAGAPRAIDIGPPFEPAPRGRELELSFGQEMVWLLEQMIPEAMFYNVVERFGIKGRLDVALLRGCIDEVVERHEILRTIYPLVEGRPVQRVEPPGPSLLEVFDLRKYPTEDREFEARRLIVANVKTRFDLERDTVLRPMLLQLGQEEFIFAVVIHHIAIDGWSLRLFIHEIASLYAAFLEGRPPELPEVTVQYSDFAHWQRRWMTGDVLTRHRDYWRGKLGKNPPILNLRADYALGSIRTFDSSVFQVTINSDTLEKLKEISRRAGATLFTVLLGAFATLLMRISGQEDFVIGSVMSARARPEVENLLGFFVNSLALRMDLSGNPTFDELVSRAREIVFAAHEHGAYPFQQLVEVMQPKRTVNSNPFVQVFLNMLNLWDRDEVSLPNLSIRPLGGLDLHMPADYFTVFASGSSQQLLLSFVYSTELFKPATIERMATGLQGLLEAAALSPQSRIWDLPMSTQQIDVPEDAVARILAELGALGIRLSADDGRLKVNAPKGVLNDALKAAIASHREEIIARLRADRPRGIDDRKLHHVARTPPLPLTAVQNRFWFLDKIGQGQSVPNVKLPLRLKGPINFDAMMAAITTVLARHEALRMRIGDREGQPYPEIFAAPEDLLAVVDLTTLPDLERESNGDRLSKEFMSETLNLVTGPLARALFVRLSPTDNLIIFSMHHIVSDGWSSSILLRELEAVYSSAIEARKPDLPALLYQYIDYAAWEVAQVHDGLFERQVNYWKEKLAGVPPVLNLPTDRPRPAERSFRGARLDCTIEADTVQRLQEFSKSHETTLFMTVLAAFGVVVHRLSDQEEIVIGTPVANRGSPELEQVVGPFVNTLSLRLSIAGNPSFASYLSQVRRTTIEAIDNRDLPFDMVVEAINPARTLDHAPICQVMFALHNFPMRPPRFKGLETSFMDLETQAARLDLQLDMVVHEGQLIGAYEYALDLFDGATIERIHAQLVEVLKGVLADEGRPVRDLPIRSPEQDRLLLNVWNNTQRDHDRGACLHQLFERVASRTPDATAFIIGGEVFSYRDVDQRANRVAHLLRLRGVRLGDRVGVCLDRTIETPVALAGVLKTGAAYVPLDPAHPADRLRYIVEDARVVCVVTMSWLVALFDGIDVPSVLLDAEGPALDDLEASAPAIPVTPEDVAYVIYTSGSTGRPKGVQVEHRNVVSFLDAMRREPGLDDADVLLAVTTLSFDIAGLEIWLPLSVGAKVVLASKTDVAVGDKLIGLIDRYRVTVMQATPSTWRLLLDAGWSGKSDLKALCGGEAMPIGLAANLLPKVAQLWNMYGPTETTIWSTAGRVIDATGAPSIGKPITNTRVYVLDSTSGLAPLGGFGELAIGGEGVARGYWNRPELTAEKFVDILLPAGGTERVYRTGDIVRFRNDGQLEFHGRRDGQIKLRGYRIELGEIEAILAASPAVKEATVVVREDDPGDQRLVAYLVIRVGEPFNQDEVRTFLKASLPGYMVPAEFVVLAAMPLTPNGKVNRAALPTPSRHTGPVSEVQSEIVMTSTQRRVADLWADILRTGRISLHDNFFDVGGHSMLVVKLHAALKREFEADLTLTELFQHTTVAAQAARLTLAADDHAALRRAEVRARKRLHG